MLSNFYNQTAFNRPQFKHIIRANTPTFAETFPKRMKKYYLFLLFAIVALQSAVAQDKHFTQFYASPLTLNPALTGVFEGKYRVSTIYRDQWRQVLDYPIKTFAVAADLRFNAPGKHVRKDAIGLGLMFFNDKVSVLDFSTTQIALSLAYHKSLDINDRQYLSIGFQGGLTQRNVNYELLNFHDQFNGSTGYVFATGENLPANNFAFPDYSFGINYSARIGRNGAIFAGLGLHHFLEPRISFYENTGKGDLLYRKFSGQFSANIPFSRDNRVSILPRVLFAVQGPHMEVNTGANFRMAMGQYGSTALHLGSWARTVKNNDGYGLDAVVALAGIEFNNVLVGLSYDLNLRALQAKQRQSAFEISIAYLGNYESEEILCPKF
jgi:type IX secretion system PorP/SprF family membrane protein